MRYLYLLLICCITGTAFGQKTVYIPNYLMDITTVDGAQFTMSKTAESANFILIWGNTVGTSPATYTIDTNLAFNPSVILDTLEAIYAAYKIMGFADDAAGTSLAHYKIPVVMYGTWGTTGAQGWANGGDADGLIGAFWVHPLAMHGGHVAAHELTHSLQAQCVIDYRTTHSMGAVWNYAGIFWETHANFMRNLLYPMDVTANGMDVSHIETWGDWKNTYENYELLMAIKETDGIAMVNRLWRESLSDEFPTQTYKRLLGADQMHFNDVMYAYARRMATYDFVTHGTYFRQYRTADLAGWLPSVQNTYTILSAVGGNPGVYRIPIEQAPEEYGYNVIPLYTIADSCSVIVRFRGHTEANAHTGWRYGFVTEHPDGTVSRYSPTYADYAREISFSLQGDEIKMYLVVMGAPYDMITWDTARDTWHGYPKHYRNPYELTISGAVPEGYQKASSFRQQLKTDGHIHPNGGGWVANTATVANTSRVDSSAMVLGYSIITDYVSIKNTAIVNNARLSDIAEVSGNAVVNEGTYSNNATITEQAYAERDTMWESSLLKMRARVSNYHLYGNIVVGGDVVVYNDTGMCNNGVYYTLTNYYDNKLLACDGRTASSPTNADINNAYTPFADALMALHCHCPLLPDCLTQVDEVRSTAWTIQALPNPASDMVTFKITGEEHINTIKISLYNAIGSLVYSSASMVVDVSALPPGMYIAKVSVNESGAGSVKVVVVR